MTQTQDDFPSRLWWRQRPLVLEGPWRERWTYERDGQTDTLDVRVRTGKRVDIKALKRQSSFVEEVGRVGEVRLAFPDRADYVTQTRCPVCRTSIAQARHEVTIWETKYYRCRACGHAYASEFPSQRAVEAFYSGHQADGGYYIRDEEIELRLGEIYRPKLEWAVDAYRRAYGKAPRSVLDLGAGAGHFLHACQGMGLKAAGVECDRVYRDWARECFGLDLVLDASMLPDEDFDLVCSFNVIEHTVDPREFLDLHKRFMSRQSLCVVETPKYDSLTTAVQGLFPDVVRTHLIPFKHNHLFTEASLATLLYENGLRLSDVWFFGQDMTELLFQAFHASGREVDMDMVNDFMRAPQAALDAAGVCDLLLVAAAPANLSNGER